MKRLALVLSLTCSVAACSAEEPMTSPGAAQRSVLAAELEAKTTKIRLTINGQSLTATLVDSSTTRDFVALLPLTLTLDDYASTEKIAYLPRKLSTQGAPAGIDPDVGDITYYAPWGNLAIFYRDFGHSTGLIRLGHFEDGMEALQVSGSMNATIEPVGKLP